MHIMEELEECTDEVILVDTNIIINLEKRKCSLIDLKAVCKMFEGDIKPFLTDLSYSSKIYLSVGLHNGYGNAQRLYVKRGYNFDGSGVWYKDKICDPYSTCINDDELQLYMYKELK